MRAPGDLRELGSDGLLAWSELVSRCLREQTAAAPPSAFLRPAPDDETPWLTAPDWPGFPARVGACLTRADALALLDWHGEWGPRALQEEYVEWRVAYEGDAIRRIEMTTEFAEYWRVLAAYEPAKTLNLVATFAGRESVAPSDVYGALEPFAADVTPDDRGAAFEAMMLRPLRMSSYNNGSAAICCMVQATNTLASLLALAVAATTARIARDAISGRQRCLTCEESIPLLGGKAMLGRGSDPVLVERFSRLAFERRLVALDDPIGVTIAGVEHSRLRTREGDAVPLEWFQFSRGADAGDAPFGRARHQRLVLETPPGTGLAVSDLVDMATEQPIRYGGQLADLVQIALCVRVSDADTVPVELPDATRLPDADKDGRDCASVRRQFRAFLGRP